MNDIFANSTLTIEPFENLKNLSDTDLADQLSPGVGALLKDHSIQYIVNHSAEEFRDLAPAAYHLQVSVEVARRLAIRRAVKKPLDSPPLTYEAFAPELCSLPTESLRVACLDTRLCLTSSSELSKGTVNQTVAHPRDILRIPIIKQAYAFILIHNHPSGDPSPSRADRDITRRVVDMAAAMEIRMIDHLIVGRPSPHHDSYFSFAEAGLV